MNFEFPTAPTDSLGGWGIIQNSKLRIQNSAAGGYTLVVVVMVIAIMGIMMAVAVQTVSFQMQREREAALQQQQQNSNKSRGVSRNISGMSCFSTKSNGNMSLVSGFSGLSDLSKLNNRFP